jgi:hypothetical protein
VKSESFLEQEFRKELHRIAQKKHATTQNDVLENNIAAFRLVFESKKEGERGRDRSLVGVRKKEENV